jgi:hypothetical protein
LATLRLPGTEVDAVAPRLAAIIHFDSVPLGTASRRVAASGDRPCSGTGLTASAQNSGAYVFKLVFVMVSPIDLVIKRECPQKSGYLSQRRLDCQDLGCPHGFFNDLLIAMIDHFLNTPEADGPIASMQSHARHRFADPGSES